MYINYGRVIADCPAGCGTAQKVEPGQAVYTCTPEKPVWGCGIMAELEWPADMDGIVEALKERPEPRNRNWFPSGHDLAVRARQPHGQTPEQLRQETRDHMGEVNHDGMD